MTSPHVDLTDFETIMSSGCSWSCLTNPQVALTVLKVVTSPQVVLTVLGAVISSQNALICLKVVTSPHVVFFLSVCCFWLCINALLSMHSPNDPHPLLYRNSPGLVPNNVCDPGLGFGFWLVWMGARRVDASRAQIEPSQQILTLGLGIPCGICHSLWKLGFAARRVDASRAKQKTKIYKTPHNSYSTLKRFLHFSDMFHNVVMLQRMTFQHTGNIPGPAECTVAIE